MSILRDAINTLDPTPDKKKELTLSLELISELASSRVRTFTEDVATSYRTAGNGENRTAPITLVIASHSEYRAYVKHDAGKIATDVADAVKKFVAGGSDNIISGIAQLVTTGLSAILGSGEAMQQEMRSYYITVQSRALVRYDVLAWRRMIEATAITSQIESALALYASKASIDAEKLDLNAFLIAYEDQLFKMGFTDKESVEYMDYAEQIYWKLRGGGGPPLGDPPNSLPSGKPSLHELLVYTPELAHTNR
jgi:hypothetical protein